VAVSATVQNNWRTVLALVYSRDIARTKSDIVRFKIGEGGSLAGSPITPDATFTDIEGEGTPLPGGGTVGFTNGSPNVTGAGTSFLADVSPGDWIKPGPTPSADPYSAGTPGTEEDVWGEVLSVTDNSNLVLTANYGGGTTIGSRAGHTASSPLYVFRKALTVADVLFDTVLPAITEITCTVGASEANTTQLGSTPEFYEIGIFDNDGVMIGYMTFDKQEKISGVQLVTIADLTM